MPGLAFRYQLVADQDPYLWKVDPNKVRLAGVLVSSKDNFGPLTEKKDAYADYKYAMDQGAANFPAPGVVFEMRILRPKKVEGGIFQLNSKKPVGKPGMPPGVPVPLQAYSILLNDKKETPTYVYVADSNKANDKYICHSVCLGVGGPDVKDPLIVNQPEAGLIFKNETFFEKVGDTDPIKTGDVLVFYARKGIQETPFHSALVTQVR
jgi:hypothetical protein